MKTFTAIIITLTGFAAAAPAVHDQRQAPLCSGLYGTAQCCATDVLGLADLDCAVRKSILLQPSLTPFYLS